mmetsp:Transcript_19969/g.28961  ORF Transcript_19969/g.28961 Transcript_19969/m.28961 type:complete len:480 (+) Transcript_19969:1-1440(+)
MSAHRISDYRPYLSTSSALRKPSAIRKLIPLMSSRPDMVSLGGGLPNPNLFPFTSLHFTVKGLIDNSGKHSSSSSDRTTMKELELSSEELGLALQYSPTPGVPQLVSFLNSLQQREHAKDLNANIANSNIKNAREENNYLPSQPSPEWNYDVSVTVGSQDGLCKAFEMLLDPFSQDDELFVESPTYPGALGFLRPYGCKLIPVPTDEHGIQPEQLSKLLQESSSSHSSSYPFGENDQQKRKKRRVLYTIPTAQNPSGSTLSNDRRIAIYHLARKYDLIILEDDPYYFLHPNRQCIPSFLSIDHNLGDGRVLRFDSFSKLLSSGMRLGFVTGPPTLVNQLNLHTQTTNLHASGISQLLAYKLLDYWGLDGFDDHAASTATFYNNRRNVLLSAAHQNLSPDLAEWNIPEAGMFLWIKILNGIHDTKTLVEEKAVDAGVLFVPGQSFCPLNEPSSYVRASYSTASDEDMNVAMERLAALIRK